MIGPAKNLTPGYYAVSVTLLYGLPWRLYDPCLAGPADSSLGPGVERRAEKTPSGTSASSSRSRRSDIRSMSIISPLTRSRGQRHYSWLATRPQRSVKLNDSVGYIDVRRMRKGLEVSLDQLLSAPGVIKGLIIDVRAKQRRWI